MDLIWSLPPRNSSHGWTVIIRAPQTFNCTVFEYVCFNLRDGRSFPNERHFRAHEHRSSLFTTVLFINISKS